MVDPFGVFLALPFGMVEVVVVVPLDVVVVGIGFGVVIFDVVFG